MRDIQKLLTAADPVNNRQKVQVCWHVGARINAERLTHSAGYHNAVSRELSADSEIALRTLQRDVRFHTLYKESSVDSLACSHYRVLLECSGDTERARLRQLAINARVHQLDLALASPRLCDSRYLLCALLVAACAIGIRASSCSAALTS